MAFKKDTLSKPIHTINYLIHNKSNKKNTKSKY